MCACTGVWVQACLLASGFGRERMCLHRSLGASVCACTRVWAQACVLASGFGCKWVCLHRGGAGTWCSCTQVLAQACVLAPGHWCKHVCLRRRTAWVQACVLAPGRCRKHVRLHQPSLPRRRACASVCACACLHRGVVGASTSACSNPLLQARCVENYKYFGKSYFHAESKFGSWDHKVDSSVKIVVLC